MLYPIAVLAAAAAVVLFTFYRTRAVLPFLASSLGGLCGLWGVSLVSVGGTCLLKLNLFNAAAAAVLGLPGVISLLFLRVIALI